MMYYLPKDYQSTSWIPLTISSTATLNNFFWILNYHNPVVWKPSIEPDAKQIAKERTAKAILASKRLPGYFKKTLVKTHYSPIRRYGNVGILTKH